MQVDHIIVGQGIAGSILAHTLLQQNKKILVIDKHSPNSASNIAAGVVNPVTGRRMAKSWMIDDILPFAIKTYRQLEKDLGLSFFFEQEIYKIFSSADDIHIWKKKKDWPEYYAYLGEIINQVEEQILSPFGAGIIKRGCWMDVPAFIKAYRQFLRSNNYLLEEELSQDELTIDDTIRYKEIIADSVIFCEGYRAHQNPLFSFIPFSIAKGEQFLIHAPQLRTNKIINKNIFIIPKGEDNYHVGSTFVWDDLEETVTAAGRSEIEDKLKRMLSCPYTILEEKAGIRPTIIDRRPVIGQHPHHPNTYIFNGLGTKGVSLAPYLADHFVQFLYGKIPLLDEISIARFAG